MLLTIKVRHTDFLYYRVRGCRKSLPSGSDTSTLCTIEFINIYFRYSWIREHLSLLLLGSWASPAFTFDFRSIYILYNRVQKHMWTCTTGCGNIYVLYGRCQEHLLYLLWSSENGFRTGKFISICFQYDRVHWTEHLCYWLASSWTSRFFTIEFMPIYFFIIEIRNTYVLHDRVQTPRGVIYQCQEQTFSLPSSSLTSMQFSISCVDMYCLHSCVHENISFTTECRNIYFFTCEIKHILSLVLSSGASAFLPRGFRNTYIYYRVQEPMSLLTEPRNIYFTGDFRSMSFITIELRNIYFLLRSSSGTSISFTQELKNIELFDYRVHGPIDCLVSSTLLSMFFTLESRIIYPLHSPVQKHMHSLIRGTGTYIYWLLSSGTVNF